MDSASSFLRVFDGKAVGKKPFLTAVGWFLMTFLSTAAVAVVPVFDFDRILGDPLEAKVLTTRQEEGVVLQEVEYTVGQSVRVYGILGYPEEGTNLPAIFWSQSGMYPASDYFPKVFAKKGYFCLSITLSHDVYDSFARFTTEDPKGGNITDLAIPQMRGIALRQDVSRVVGEITRDTSWRNVISCDFIFKCPVVPNGYQLLRYFGFQGLETVLI